MPSAILNRQPAPLNQDALVVLQQKGLRKRAEVRTSDDYPLGFVLRIHHRQEEIDPDLKLYAAYLQVANLRLGTHFYVPTDFVQAYDAEKRLVTLAVKMSVVQAELWDREPTFVAGEQGRVEELPV